VTLNMPAQDAPKRTRTAPMLIPSDSDGFRAATIALLRP
jgi:hypothetical protein